MSSLQVRRVMLLERLQNTYLDPACVAVLLHGSDDLDRDFTPRRYFAGFDNFAKRALA